MTVNALSGNAVAVNVVEANSVTANSTTNGSTNEATSRPDAAVGGLEEFGPLIVIALLIIGAGGLGGLGARMIAGEPPPAAAEPPPSKWRFTILGIIAAACVPLFLSLVQSGLIEEILNNRHEDRLESYLIFAGLCLVAAISARTFLDSLSKRVLRDLDRKVDQANQKAEDAKETALDVAEEQLAEPRDERVVPETAAIDSSTLPAVEDDERRALEAMTKLSFRTATGIAVDSGMPINQIGEVLDSLSLKGLVNLVPSPTTKRPRWTLTPAGMALLRGKGRPR